MTNKTNPVSIRLSGDARSVDKYLHAQKLIQSDLEDFGKTITLSEHDNPMIIKYSFKK